jgi:hypothetical protein
MLLTFVGSEFFRLKVVNYLSNAKVVFFFSLLVLFLLFFNSC